jgi:hypothetical protein
MTERPARKRSKALHDTVKRQLEGFQGQNKCVERSTASADLSAAQHFCGPYGLGKGLVQLKVIR